MKDKYVFLRTVEQGGEIMAMIGDTEVLGPRISDLQCAFRAHASPMSPRKGVFTMTSKQLKDRLPTLKKKKMHESVTAFERALHRIEEKNGKTPAIGAHEPAPLSG
ncbi:MAG TPA: hypothetical protein VI728_05515 [Syntrophales bacterium]|nr:hypothetical protein [Syntrophales bacterium]